MRIKNEASANGTKIHNILESYLKNRENLDLLEFEEESGLAKKMANLIISEGIEGKLNEIHGVECTLYFPGSKGYAGTADLVATFESQLSICDYKQKNSIMKESYSSYYKSKSFCAPIFLLGNYLSELEPRKRLSTWKRLLDYISMSQLIL